MPANMICQICETLESAHVCFTCVNPSQEINVCGGVLICASCKLSHHNSGIFLLHQTTSLEARYKRRLLQGRIRGFQLSVSENINNEVVSLNVRNAMNKAKVEASKTYVHKQLMEVYNAITSQLNAKEKELNKHVESNFRILQEESDVCRNKLKELNSTVATKSETLLSKLADENEEVDIEKIEAELEELESNVRSGLNTKMENKLGPYVKVNRGRFEVDQTVDIGTFKISQIDFYGVDEILQSPELFKETNTIEEDTNYVVSASFLTRAMLSQRQSILCLPHPLLTKHGLWLRDAIEYYIQRNFEQNQFVRLGDHELPDYNSKSIVLVKSRAQEYPPIMRCRFSFPENEDKSKGKKILRPDKATPEVSIYPVDHYNLPVKTLPLNKVFFYKIDSYLEKVQLLMIKVGFNEVQNSKGTTFPEISPNARKKIQKALETGKEMSIHFKKLVTTPNADKPGLWSVEASVDGTCLSQLLVEGEEAEVEKPKLCKDIRLQSGDNVPVIREIVGESAARPAQEVTKELIKEPVQFPVSEPEQSDASQPKNEPERSCDAVETSQEVTIEVDISKEFTETTTGYDCLEVNNYCTIGENNPINLLKTGSTASSIEEPSPVDSKECLKLLVLKRDQPSEPQLAPNFRCSDSSNTKSSKDAIPDELTQNSKNLAEQHDGLTTPGQATRRVDGPRSGGGPSKPALSSTPQDVVFNESWLKDAESQPLMTQQLNVNSNVTAPQSTKIQGFDQQPAPFLAPTVPPGQNPAMHHSFDYRQVTSSGPQPYATPPTQHQSYNNSSMTQPPSTLDDPSKRCLSYLALVVYGEQSQEFQNSLCTEEPGPQIKRALYDQIQSQQSVWRLVPRELLLPLMDVEMQRFPYLSEEFRRFGVPMNIYKLPFALGPQLYVYAERYPELKTILNTINYEPVYPPPTTSQPQQPFNSRLSTVGPGAAAQGAAEVDDRGDSQPLVTDGNAEIMPEKGLQSQVSRGSQNHATSQHSSNTKHGSRAPPDNGDTDFKGTNDGDCNRGYRGVGGPSNQGSNYQDAEDWGASPDNGWMEEDDNSMAPSGGRSDSYRSNRLDKASKTCFNCNETGHSRSECPKRNHWNSQRRDSGRESGRTYNSNNRRSDGHRSRTGGRGEGFNDTSWNSTR